MWRGVGIRRRQLSSVKGRVNGDLIHLLRFSPVAYSVQEENGPRGGCVPKGPLVRGRIRAGIPAPRFSRREISINPGGDYPTCRNGVKANFPLLTAGTASGVGGQGSGASGRGQRGIGSHISRCSIPSVSQLSQRRLPLLRPTWLHYRCYPFQSSFFSPHRQVIFFSA